MTERVVALHPQKGKQGTNIDRHMYETIKDAILAATEERVVIAFKDLAEAVRSRIAADFAGSVSWYVTTVKLDLEARGLIERIPGMRPQHLRLTHRTG